MNRKKGIITKADTEKGISFIKSDCLKNELIFAHVSNIANREMPKINDEIEFDLDFGDRGPRALKIINLTMSKVNENSSSAFAELKDLKIDSTLATKSETKQIVESNVLDFKVKTKSDKNIKSGYNFYIVFDPTLNSGEDRELDGLTQGHSFYNLIKKSKPNETFFWGKYKASTGNAELHFENFTQVIKANKEEKVQTILYISDYQYFWAAKVENVHRNIDAKTKSHKTLEFYRKNWDKIEIWFEISDMVLVSANNVETNTLIKSLCIKKCNNHNSMTISNDVLHITPYTSNLRYPLIIENLNYVNFFDDESERQVDKLNPLIEDYNSAHQIEQIIKSYLIPQEIYNKISYSLHNEIIRAESKYLELKTKTPNCRYHLKTEIAADYLRILEGCLKDLLINQYKHPSLNKTKFTLGSLNILLQHHQLSLKNASPDFYRSLILVNAFLSKEQIDIRNGKIHTEAVNTSEEHLEEIRMAIIGVGCEGLLNLLYKSFYNIEVSANKAHYKLAA